MSEEKWRWGGARGVACFCLALMVLLSYSNSHIASRCCSMVSTDTDEWLRGFFVACCH